MKRAAATSTAVTLARVSPLTLRRPAPLPSLGTDYRHRECQPAR
ncbi:hypothetical protein ACFDTO_09065 [Microbacteriaceae bacterium 4G12]